MTDIAIQGWTHVHTYHESHGEHVADTYQKEPAPGAWSRRVELLHVTRYRDGRATGLRTECDKHSHDYLLAKAIRANAEGRYTQDGDRSVTPCCTAGHDDFTDTQTLTRYRIFGAAGHGEWAFEITDADKDA